MADSTYERPPSVAAAWVVAVFAPIVSSLAYGSFLRGRMAVLGLVAAVVLTGVAVLRERSWGWVLVGPAAAVVGVAAYQANGKFVGAWVAIAMVQACWGVLRRTPLPLLPQPDRSAVQPLVVLAVVGSILYRKPEVTHRYALGLLVGGFIVIALASLHIPLLDRVARRVERVAARVFSWLAVPVLAVAGMFVVFVPWGVHRILRWDPTGQGGRSVSGWVRRRKLEQGPERLWLADPVGARVPLAGRAHGVVVSIATAAGAVAWAMLLATIVEALVPAPGPPPPPENAPQNQVMESMFAEPWWEEFRDGSADAFKDSRISQWVGLEMPDFESKYLNERDGKRATWQPPSSCGAPLDVWMFGGSTLYGVGNRDDHTIASELAREAEANGVALDISNYGVPGDVGWQQVRRLERALFTAEDKPDLVIFYDGGNDMMVPQGLNTTDRLFRGDFVGPLDRVHMTLLANLTQEVASGRYVLRPRKPPEVTTWTENQVIQRSVDQYLEADHQARLVLDDAGVPFAHVLQPTVADRLEPVAGEAEFTDDDANLAKRFGAAMTEDIIDISDTFDEVPSAHFNDLVHLDEAGNAIVATRMWRELADQVEPLADAKGATCS